MSLNRALIIYRGPPVPVGGALQGGARGKQASGVRAGGVPGVWGMEASWLTPAARESWATLVAVLQEQVG